MLKGPSLERNIHVLADITITTTRAKKEILLGLSGSRTRGLSHPKRESCH